LFSIAASLGSTESLVVAPAMQQPRGLNEEQRGWTDIHAGTVRLSVGIEDGDDLLEIWRRPCSGQALSAPSARLVPAPGSVPVALCYSWPKLHQTVEVMDATDLQDGFRLGEWLVEPRESRISGPAGSACSIRCSSRCCSPWRPRTARP